MGNESASWEDIVLRVSIASNYYNVEDAANGWEGVFASISDLEENLRTLKKNSESWKGGAADSFREQLDAYVKDAENLNKDHVKIVQGLRACKTHLKNAVDVIPIPSWMMSELENKQSDYQMGAEVPGYSPGSFGHFYLKHVMGDAYSNIPLVGSAWKKLESWLIDNEEIAKKAYSKLQDDYGGETGSIPTGTQVTPVLSDPSQEFDPSGFGGGGGGGGAMPKLDPSSLGPSSMDPPGGPTSSFNPDDMTTTDPQYPEGFDPDDLPPGTELAGGGGGLVSGPGGFGGGGLGGGGLGGGLGGGGLGGGGLGGGGLGAGGLGAGAARGLGGMPLGGVGAGMGGGGAGRGGGKAGGRMPGLGTGVTPPAGILGNRGGAGGRGGALGGRGAGMMGGAGHGAGSEEERTADSWLIEDEDPWGAEGDAPPGVLGG